MEVFIGKLYYIIGTGVYLRGLPDSIEISDLDV